MVLKWALCGTSLVAFTHAAQAQAQASTQSAIGYALSVDANSIDPTSDLGVTDGGIHTFNTIQPGSGAPYTNTVGAGASASASVSNLTEFDLPTLAGYNGVSSSASVSGPSGSAKADVGSEERLTLTDTGTNSITLDFDVEALLSGNGGVTWLGESAMGEGYAGIYAFDEATSDQVDLHLITLNTAAFAPPNFNEVGNWAQTGAGTYSAEYSIIVNSGQLVGVTFYSNAYAYSSANAVPAPNGWMTIGVGLAGLALRRRAKR